MFVERLNSKQTRICTALWLHLLAVDGQLLLVLLVDGQVLLLIPSARAVGTVRRRGEPRGLGVGRLQRAVPAAWRPAHPPK